MDIRRTFRKRGWWSFYTVLILILLLVFQSIWFVATTTLKDHEQFETEIRQILDERSRIKASAGDASAASAASLMEPLDLRLDDLYVRRNAAVGTLIVWNSLWRQGGDSDVALEQRCKGQDEICIGLWHVRSANGATQILGLYVLPLLYGWLGALLWVLQKLREDDTEAAVMRLKPGARVVAGMVAGPMIGLFISPDFFSSLAVQATPFLIAFLGGYSTDVFFALLDRLLASLRGAFEKSTDADRKPPEGEAERAPAEASKLRTDGQTP